MVDGASPIDLAHFTSFTNGDQQLERELSSLYMTTADTRLDEMRQALAAGLPWDGPAHELKGASANLGAVEVAALAAEAETATPSEAQLSRLTAALDTVRTSSSCACGPIARRSKRLSGPRTVRLLAPSRNHAERRTCRTLGQALVGRGPKQVLALAKGRSAECRPAADSS